MIGVVDAAVSDRFLFLLDVGVLVVVLVEFEAGIPPLIDTAIEG